MQNTRKTLDVYRRVWQAALLPLTEALTEFRDVFERKEASILLFENWAVIMIIIYYLNRKFILNSNQLDIRQ